MQIRSIKIYVYIIFIALFLFFLGGRLFDRADNACTTSAFADKFYSTEFSGCLGSEKGSLDDGKRFPAKSVQRGVSDDSDDKVIIQHTTSGIVISHELQHHCCLKSKTDALLEGGKITLTETLYGEVCRCICQSTIKTSLSLLPGNYRLMVYLDDRGNKRLVHDSTLTHKKP